MYYLRPPATLVRFVTANLCSWLMRGLHLLSALFLATGSLPMISLPPSTVPFSDERSQPQAESDLLQFSHTGHIFGFKSGSFYLSNAGYALHVDFIGANPVKRAPVILNFDGSLSLTNETGAINERASVVWQEVAGQLVSVEVAFLPLILKGRQILS